MSQRPPTSYDVVVLGGGPAGVELASDLSDSGRRVAVFDDETVVARARRRGLTAHESSPESANPPFECSAETVIVGTRSDARNLLLATTAPGAFDADRVVVLVNDPDREVAFDDAGIETVCVARAVTRATTESLAQEDPVLADGTDETDERTRLRE